MDSIHKILCLVSFNGMRYFGFERTYGLRTVCGDLEKVFSKVAGEKVRVEYGFTLDARASAKNMPIVAIMGKPMDAADFMEAVERIMPPNIKLHKAQNVDPSYEIASHHFIAEYEYSILNEKDTAFFEDSYVYVEQADLDLDLMRLAAEYLIGENDLSCFSETKGTNAFRTIHDISIESFKSRIYFTITGDTLLKNMVPMIAGELLMVGKGLRSPDFIPRLIASGEVDEMVEELPTLVETVTNIVEQDRPEREIHSCNDRWDYYVLNMDAEKLKRSYVIIYTVDDEVLTGLLNHILDRNLKFGVEELYIIEAGNRISTKMEIENYIISIADVNVVEEFSDKIASYRMRGTWYQVVRGTKTRMVER